MDNSNNDMITIYDNDINSIVLLQPYRNSIKKECKIFCQDLFNLIIPIITLFLIISVIIIILYYIK